jgi:hypothetical protein
VGCSPRYSRRKIGILFLGKCLTVLDITEKKTHKSAA